MSRKIIKIKLPEGQLLKLLGFADEMLMMVEASAGKSSAEEKAAKQLRHIFNKTFNLYKAQINER
tara:strand:+ start:315 stop:509 length:195 start_codon:yes stop_codon:yes gene_type:complete